MKALIQFTLSKDDDTFEATYLSFNDVPQNMFTLSALLEAAFTDDEMNDGVGDSDSANEDENIDENALLKEFINLICSYSDPPDLEGDALQEYFREEFESWRAGESYTNITADADDSVDTIMQTFTDMNCIFPENTGLYLLNSISILPICINY